MFLHPVSPMVTTYVLIAQYQNQEFNFAKRYVSSVPDHTYKLVIMTRTQTVVTTNVSLAQTLYIPTHPLIHQQVSRKNVLGDFIFCVNPAQSISFLYDAVPTL